MDKHPEGSGAAVVVVPSVHRARHNGLMAEQKTRPTGADPREFLDGVEHAGRRQDCLRLLEIFEEETGQPPRMWGPSMVGFGEYRYVYRSGHEGRSLAVGFAPRASAIALYGLVEGPRAESLLAELGPHKRSVACVYATRLGRLDEAVLRSAVREAYARITGPEINADHPDFAGSAP